MVADLAHVAYSSDYDAIAALATQAGLAETTHEHNSVRNPGRCCIERRANVRLLESCVMRGFVEVLHPL